MNLFLRGQPISKFFDFFERRFGLSSPGVGSRLARGAFWSLIGTLIYRALTLASSIVAAHILGKEGFGTLAIVQSTIAMFQAVAGYSLGLTATKYVSEFRKSSPDRAGRIIGISDVSSIFSGLLVGAIVFECSNWLAVEAFGAPSLAPLLRISSLMIILGAYNGAQTGTISGFEDFRAIARVNFLSGVISFPLMIAGLWLGGLNGGVWALVISMAMSCGLSQIEVLRICRSNNVKIRFAGASSEWQILWRFYLPALLSGSLVAPIIWAGNALLVRTPNGFSHMAILSAANQWRTIMMYLPSLIVQVSLPMLSGEQSDASTTNNFGRAMTLTHDLMVTISFPLGAGLMYFSEPILRLYGKGFDQGSAALIGFACASLLQCIGAAAGPCLESRGRMWSAAFLNGVWGGLYIVTVYLTVNRFAALSLAFSSAFAYLVLTLLSFFLLRQELPRGMLSRAIRTALAAVAMTALCIALPVHLRTEAGVLVAPGVMALVLSTSFGKAVFLNLFSRRSRPDFSQVRPLDGLTEEHALGPTDQSQRLSGDSGDPATAVKY